MMLYDTASFPYSSLVVEDVEGGNSGFDHTPKQTLNTFFKILDAHFQFFNLVFYILHNQVIRFLPR